MLATPESTPSVTISNSKETSYIQEHHVWKPDSLFSPDLGEKPPSVRNSLRGSPGRQQRIAAHYRCIGDGTASSSRTGVTSVSQRRPCELRVGDHWSHRSTKCPSCGCQVVLKPSPIACRNYAPNDGHRADASESSGSFTRVGDLMTASELCFGMVPCSLSARIPRPMHYCPYMPLFAAIARDMTLAKRPGTS